MSTPSLPPDRRRWLILAVACLAVFVTVLDGTIVNVALPSLSRELGATTRQLQWIVDAYLLVFTALLLVAGSIGDRFGRRRILVTGLVVFAVTSIFAGSASSAGSLLAGRALMGVGAAMIFPATLAIITNAFPDARERAKAIGLWSAASGMAVAAGPVAGGWLLEHFWWGSVFYVNVPVVVIAIAGALAWIPESKDTHAPRLDKVGFGLSMSAIFALVFTIIQAPEWGWTRPSSLAGFAAAVVLLALFTMWELHVDEPMLPVRIFRNLRFSAASLSVTAAFFALFGFVFLITQYFQLVRGYDPLQAGIRTVPVALAIATASVLAPRFVERVGTTRIVAAGLFSMAVGFAWISTDTGSTSYLVIVAQMMFLGLGLGMTTAPATESIMGSLPADKAGVGSAVNDTTRELGGTLGVAVVGSVFSSVYVGALDKGVVFRTLSPEGQHASRESVTAAVGVAGRLGVQAPAFIGEVRDAFLSGLGVACWVAAGVALAGSLFALKFLPARATDPADEGHEVDLRPAVGVLGEPALAG